MQGLGDIMRHSPKTPLMRSVVSASVVEKANEILKSMFGVKVMDHAQAMYVRQGKLYIACLSGAAAQEIRLRELAILEALNETQSALPIASIHFIA